MYSNFGQEKVLEFGNLEVPEIIHKVTEISISPRTLNWGKFSLFSVKMRSLL